MKHKNSIKKYVVLVSSCAVVFLVSSPFAYAEETRETLAKENYMQADTNGDTMLTLDEFTTFIDLNADDGLGRAGMIRDRGMHGFAFRRVDANSDGLVAPEELAAMAR